MLDLVRDLSLNKCVNVLVSSHLLPDIESTCSHVVVMAKGRVVMAGPIAELTVTRGRAFELRVKNPEGAEPFAARLQQAGVECHPLENDVMRVVVPGDGGARELFALAAASGAQVRHLRPSVTTLEDVFTDAVGEE